MIIGLFFIQIMLRRLSKYCWIIISNIKEIQLNPMIPIPMPLGLKPMVQHITIVTIRQQMKIGPSLMRQQALNI